MSPSLSLSCRRCCCLLVSTSVQQHSRRLAASKLRNPLLERFLFFLFSTLSLFFFISRFLFSYYRSFFATALLLSSLLCFLVLSLPRARSETYTPRLDLSLCSLISQCLMPGNLSLSPRSLSLLLYTISRGRAREPRGLSVVPPRARVENVRDGKRAPRERERYRITAARVQRASAAN